MTQIFLEEAYKPLVSPQVASVRAGASDHEVQLWQALEEVEDPEYPVSVVDMGLIYNVAFQDSTAHIDLSFTSMGCPCMEYIIDDVRKRLLEEPMRSTCTISAA